MFKKIGHKILKTAICYALKKPAPKRIPLTGDRAKLNDSYTVEIRTLDGEYVDLLVNKISPVSIEGLKMDVGTDGLRQYLTPSILEMKSLGKFEFSSTHYYKNYQFSYNSPYSLLIVDGLNLYVFRIWYEKLVQWLFNLSTEERTDRILLLKELLQIRIQGEIHNKNIIIQDNLLSGVELFKRVYGEKIFSHPNSTDLLIKFVFIMESLVHSGEVSKKGYTYQANPIAMKTIAEFEEDNRREKSRARHNILIAALTIVITSAAVFQAISEKS